MRIGLFGGTFNPIHNGHIAIAKTAKEIFNLDDVYFIPAGNPYMKDKNELASFDDRCMMVAKAIKPYDWAWLGTDELPSRPSYTAETLKRWKSVCPNASYYLIFGQDAYEQMGTWKDYEYILENSQIIVAARNADEVKELYGHKDSFHWFYCNHKESSTEIRDRVNEGYDISDMTPAEVVEYINAHQLYIKPTFNAPRVTRELIKWIRDKMNSFSKESKAVIGISGGKDSTIVAALCAAALGPDRVYGVTMPNGTQADIDDSLRVIDFLEIHHIPFNIQAITNACKLECTLGMDIAPSKDAMINMPARVRMTMLYMVAQTLGNAFVINTCNLSEDWVGYSTWHGDSAGDFSPLARLTTEEVVEVGNELELPYDLTHKKPSDGLCGQTDEDKLGFTYEVLNKYIRTGQIEDPAIKEKIDRMHEKNLFKLQPLDYFDYEGEIHAE